MARLITVYWRDIPAQVIAKRGRHSAKAQLSERFLKAIDRAAMRAGKGSSAAYLDQWRREPRACGDDLEAEVSAEAQRLESEYPDERLSQLIRSKGAEGG